MQYLFQDHMLPDLCPTVCRRIWPVFVPSYSGFILVLLRVAYSVHVYNILAGGSQRGTRCRQIAPSFFLFAFLLPLASGVMPVTNPQPCC